MKLHITATGQYQTITAYDDHSVEVNAVRFAHSLVLLPEMAPQAWPVSDFDALGIAHFAQIEAYAPDLVILGTGLRQRFVHPSLISCLTNRRIGVESMDNKAACRTYNILMTEGRKVALALIIGNEADNAAVDVAAAAAADANANTATSPTGGNT
jgi:uncharacterized protein